jgi:thioredoxin reductase
LRAEPAWIESLNKEKNVKVLLNTEVTELLGEKKLEKVKLSNGEEISIDGLFIEIGSVPNTELIEKMNVKIDKEGFIIVDREQKTNIDGVFAAGDATNTTDLKQVITAGAQGAIAVYSAFVDLKK